MRLLMEELDKEQLETYFARLQEIVGHTLHFDHALVEELLEKIYDAGIDDGYQRGFEKGYNKGIDDEFYGGGFVDGN